jgi:hypothetical protein
MARGLAKNTAGFFGEKAPAFFARREIGLPHGQSQPSLPHLTRPSIAARLQIAGSGLALRA